MTTKKQNTKYKKIKVCPECNNTKFKTDTTHAETYCSKCGLIITAPPTYGIIYPNYKIIKIPIKQKTNNLNKWIQNKTEDVKNDNRNNKYNKTNNHNNSRNISNYGNILKHAGYTCTMSWWINRVFIKRHQKPKQ